MKVRGLGVAGGTVVVVGPEKIITFNVVENVRVDTISDLARIATFDPPYPLPLERPDRMGLHAQVYVSPDLSRIATMWTVPYEKFTSAEIHDVSTGRRLAGFTLGKSVLKPLSTLDGFRVTDASEDSYLAMLWFTADGRQVWGTDHHCSSMRGWEIIEDDESGTTKLEPLDKTISPPGVLPWLSSYGYTLTDDGWMLSPAKKRLLLLPHGWRSSKLGRTWNRQFLALKQDSQPEAVILECALEN